MEPRYATTSMSVISQTHMSSRWNVCSTAEVAAALNLGTGQGVSVKQVLDAIAIVTGEQLTVKEGDRRPGDPPVLVADPSLASRELNFRPRFSDLTTVVATAWAWHRRAHPKKNLHAASTAVSNE